MPALNTLVLIGNCTRDPEVKYLQSGTALCDVGIAINDRYKNKSGEWVDEVTFVDVTIFGRTAEVAGEYLHKGDPVAFQGKLKTDSWEKDGKKFSKLKVVADKLQLLGGRQRDDQPAPRNEYQQAPPSSPGPPPDEDIPFSPNRY